MPRAGRARDADLHVFRAKSAARRSVRGRAACNRRSRARTSPEVRALFQFGEEESLAYNIFAFDVSSKLFCGPTLPTRGGDLAFTWLYRVVLFFRFEVRRASDLGPRWGANEWLHAVPGDVTLGETTRRDGRELVARDAASGEKRWSHRLAANGTEPLQSVIGCTENAALLADRSARNRERGEWLLAFLCRTPDSDSAEARCSMHVPDPVSAVDGLLAATAIVHDLTLVTRNVKHVARTGVRLHKPVRLLIGGTARVSPPRN